MSSEIVIIGVLVAIIFYEITKITPGGIIVPGILVLYFNNPEKIITTLVVAIISYFIVSLLAKRFLIFGKRKFSMLILISYAIFIIANLIASIFVGYFSFDIISMIGYTTAGIIASNMSRQGVLKTTLSLSFILIILECILLLSRGL